MDNQQLRLPRLPSNATQCSSQSSPELVLTHGHCGQIESGISQMPSSQKLKDLSLNKIALRRCVHGGIQMTTTNIISQELPTLLCETRALAGLELSKTLPLSTSLAMEGLGCLYECLELNSIPQAFKAIACRPSPTPSLSFLTVILPLLQGADLVLRDNLFCTDIFLFLEVSKTVSLSKDLET